MGVFEASTTTSAARRKPIHAVQQAQAIETRSAPQALADCFAPNGRGSRVENATVKLQTELASAWARKSAGEIAMHAEPDGLIISLREVGFFESGSAQMKAEAQAASTAFAAMLRIGRLSLADRGHTDNAPIHTAAVSLELGTVYFPGHWKIRGAAHLCARVRSRSSECVRIMRISRSWQSHCGRPRMNRRVRYRDSGPRIGGSARQTAPQKGINTPAGDSHTRPRYQADGCDAP